MRATFFRKTRIPALVLYAALAALGIINGANAWRDSPKAAVSAIAVGFGLALVLFPLIQRLPISARTARVLIPAGAVLGVVAGTQMGTSAWSSGVLSGLLFGIIVGVARNRRHLARDDDLLLRQRALGFDPERPFGWWRSKH